MKRLRSILLYLSETASPEAALRRAEALAAANDAALLVVDVLPDSDGPWLIVPGRPELQKAVAITHLRELRTLVAPLRTRNVAVEAQVLTGRPSLEIIRQVLRNEHDLVLMTAEANGGGLGRQRFGNTTRHLLRQCPCPVWVIRRDKYGPHRRTLAAVDPGADWSEQDDSLRVLDLAASVAESDGSELRIVHCLSHWIRNGDSERLNELLARCDLSCVRHDVRVQRGGAVDIIAALGEEVDTLVMGTIWRGGPGALIGDTAEKVLAQVECSVLAVKPRGFCTPVGESASRGWLASAARQKHTFKIPGVCPEDSQRNR